MLLLTYVNTLAFIVYYLNKCLTNHIPCTVQYQKCFQYTIPGPCTCKISQQFLSIFHTTNSSVAQHKQFVCGGSGILCYVWFHVCPYELDRNSNIRWVAESACNAVCLQCYLIKLISAVQINVKNFNALRNMGLKPLLSHISWIWDVTWLCYMLVTLLPWIKIYL